jgi:hypothetical protein
MRILSVAIKNYRQYKNLKIDFLDPKKNHDLIVFIGQNSFGKTNFANAICWCLWEKEPDLALKEKTAGKPICNVDALQECQKNGQPFVEVEVSIQLDLQMNSRRKMLITRKCKCTAKGLAEEPSLAVVIQSDDSTKNWVISRKDDAQSEIECYYPSDLSDYLIFDGERLTTYFQSGQADKIKQSIINLAGLNRLDEAIRHHGEIMRVLDGQITNNSDVCIDEIEYVVVYYQGDEIASVSFAQDVYHVDPGKTVTEEVSPWGIEYDKYEIYLNQAHTFGF